MGTIAPDCVPRRNITHHSAPHFNESDALTFLIGKINLRDCLPDFNINTSYGRGYFLHLLMDNEYYCNILGKDEEKFSQISYEQLENLLNNDYDVTSFSLKNKYNVVYPSVVAQFDMNVSGTPVLLDMDDYCDLIDRIAAVDLMGEYKRLG